MPNAEIELKLLLPGAHADTIESQLGQLGIFARRRPQSRWLSNIYYDTPDQALRRQRQALRMRSISKTPVPLGRRGERAAGGDWVQTFKSAGTSQGGLSQRGEWESRETSGQLNAASLRGTPWDELDPDGRLFDALRPCFETRCRRTIWHVLRYQGASIEVALDVGEIIAAGQKLPILELELELKSGPPAALFQLAQAIAARVAVLPCDASKAERGYQLARGVMYPASQAHPPGLAREVEPLEASQTALSETLEQFTRNLASFLGSDAPEVVHQARVAWRRWRSALGLFEPWLPQRPDARGLTPFLQALGQLRDLDVLRTDTLDRWLPAFIDGSASRQRTATQALKRIDQARAAQRARTRSALADPVTGLALLGLAGALFELGTDETTRTIQESLASNSVEWVQPKKKKSARQGEWAIARMAQLQHRMERALKASAQPKASLPQIHRARILAKKTRYAAEMLRDLLPDKACKALTRKATAVQTRVGEARDLQQAAVLLQALKVSPALVEFLRGVLAGR